MSRVVQQDVLGFQVSDNTLACAMPRRIGVNRPVDHVELVQVLQSAEQFRSVKPASVLIESSFSLEMIEQLSAVNCRQDNNISEATLQPTQN